MDGRTIADNDELVENVASRPIEDKVEIEVLRVVESGELEAMKFEVVLSERPSETELVEIKRERGKREELLIAVKENVAEDTSKRLGLKITAADGGLEILAINPRSLGEKEDLRPGDLITKVNSKNVRTEEEFDKAIESVGKRANHLIHFLRGKEEFWKFVPVK
ncbi:MAG: PDZ domain-containing protein [Proteobacteria bacterium]|nr:PDZ domain-containing protein [Pseudomonadota bacterium]